MSNILLVLDFLLFSAALYYLIALPACLCVRQSLSLHRPILGLALREKLDKSLTKAPISSSAVSELFLQKVSKFLKVYCDNLLALHQAACYWESNTQYIS